MRVAARAARLVVARTLALAQTTRVVAAATYPAPTDGRFLVADGVVLAPAVRVVLGATRVFRVDRRPAARATRVLDLDVRVSTLATRLVVRRNALFAVTPSLAPLPRSRRSTPTAPKRLIRHVVIERVSRPLLARFLEKYAAAFFEANGLSLAALGASPTRGRSSLGRGGASSRALRSLAGDGAHR